MLLKRTCWFTVGLLFALTTLSPMAGQGVDRDLQATRQQSMERLENKAFRSALIGFRMLMQEEPENPMWSYYTGRCLVEMNEHLDEAIELLFAASTRGVPADVNYYLGLAYHRNYDFTDALRYFGRFEVEATRQELKAFDLDRMIATSRSAREITATYNPFQVMNVSFIDLFDSLQFKQIKMKGGQLQRKPEPYFREDEERNGITGLMFMPASTVRGDYLYYSGYTRSGKEGAQLFRARKGTARSWGEPEEIGMLNSEGDDVMPYFDPVEDDLYFASNGRPGIGGYDLYRSHYDREHNSWSEPINMGFPINSAMDEILLLPGSDLGMFMFFTTRKATDSTLTVYRVHLSEPKEKTVPNDFKMLQRIANLGGVADELLAELEQLETGPSSEAGSLADRGDTGPPEKPEITEVTILSEDAPGPHYQLSLSEALQHQAASDSLKDLATMARTRVRESEDPNDRWVWQQQIMLWEKKASDEEELADALYRQVEEERSVSGSAAPDVPGTIEVDTTIDELTVYRYTREEEQQEEVQQPADPGGGNTRQTSEEVPQEEPLQSEDPGSGINRFTLLERSPYGAENPIPVDLPLQEGTIYRIQVGVFSAEVQPDAFGGITPITGEHLTERGLIRYYAGEFSHYEDAAGALSLIRSYGLEDAFMVAWYDGNPITTDRAKQLE